MASTDTANDDEYAFDEFDEDSYMNSPGKSTAAPNATTSKPVSYQDDIVDDHEDLDALMTNTVGLGNDEYGDDDFVAEGDSPVKGGTAEIIRASLTNGIIPAEISSKYERFFSFDAEEESVDTKGAEDLTTEAAPARTNQVDSISPVDHYSDDEGHEDHVMFIDNNFDNFGNNEDDRDEHEDSTAEQKTKKDTNTAAGPRDDYEEEFYELELAPAVDRKSSLKKNDSLPEPSVEVSAEDTRSGESGGEIDLSYINGLLANNAKILESAAAHTSGSDGVPNVPSSSSRSPSPRGPTSSGGGPGYFNVLDVLSSEKIATTNLNNTNTKKFVKVEEVAAKDIGSLSFNVDSTGNTISIVSPSPVLSDSAAVAPSVSSGKSTNGNQGSSSSGGGGSVDTKRLSILKNKVTKVRGASMSSDTSNGDKSSRERERSRDSRDEQQQLVESSGAKRKQDEIGSEQPSTNDTAPPPSSSVMVSPLSSRKKSNTSDASALAAANKKKAALAAAKAAAQEEYDELMALVENPAAAAAVAGGGGADDASVGSQSSRTSKGRGTIRGTVVRGTIARVGSNASANSTNSAASNAAALAALSDIQQKNALLPMQLPSKGISNAPSNRASIRKTIVPPARHVKKANVGVTPLIAIIQKKPAPPAAAPVAKKPRRVGVSVPDDQVYDEDFNALEEGDILSAAADKEGTDKQASSTSGSPVKARSSVRFADDSEVEEGSSAASHQKPTKPQKQMAPLNIQTTGASLNTLMVEGLVTPPREVDNVETSRSVPNKTTGGKNGNSNAPVHPKVRGASIRLYNPVPPAGGGNKAAAAAAAPHRAAGSIRRVVAPKGSEGELPTQDSKTSSAAAGIAAHAEGSAVDGENHTSEVKKPANAFAKVQGTMHTQPVKPKASVLVTSHPVSDADHNHVEEQHVNAAEGAPVAVHHKKHPSDSLSKVQGTMHTQPVKTHRPSVAAAVHHSSDSHHMKPHDPYASVQGTMHTQPAKANRTSIIQHSHGSHGSHATKPKNKNHENSAAEIEEEVVEEEEDGGHVASGRKKQEQALDSLIGENHHDEVSEYENDTDFVEESLDSFEEASPSTHTIHNNSNGMQQHGKHSHHHEPLDESSAGVSTVSDGTTQSHYVTRLHQHVSVAGRMKNHLFPRANKDPYSMYDESSGLFSSYEVEYQRASRLEQYRIANAEKERQKQIEIETARYSYMKRNQELLVEKHFKEMKLIRDNAQREERVEALRAQHIVAYEKIHNELEEIRLRMENLTHVQGNYKNNYIRVAGNIIPPAPKHTSYQPTEPHRRVKYKNPVAQAPRHFEQVTVKRQQQQPQPQQQHQEHHHSVPSERPAMKPTAPPMHNKPAYGASYKKGKFIKQMPPANAPRKEQPVRQPSPPTGLPVNEFGDLTADASDLHSNPSNIVISEFYDQEDFNPEETTEVEEAMNGVLLANHNNSSVGGGGGGNESYHSLHNTNYSSLPVELVSVHSPINNVVKVTKTTMVIDVDRMAEDGADMDTPVGSAAVGHSGSKAAGGASTGKISRDSSAGYHLYYDPDEEEQQELGEALSPVRARGLHAGGALEEDESISDSNAHGFMADMVNAAGSSGRNAGVTATFKSSADYDDEGFEEEDSQYPHTYHSSVGFYTMEFDGEDEQGTSSVHSSGQKQKRKGTPMRRVRAADLEEEEDDDDEGVNGGGQTQAAAAAASDEYHEEYADTFEESEGGAATATLPGGGDTRGLMAGSITSLDYSGDFNPQFVSTTGSGFPFSASSSQVLDSTSQVDSVFAQLDSDSSNTSGGGGGGVAGGRPKYDGIAANRLNSTYMSHNEDFNGDEDLEKTVTIQVIHNRNEPVEEEDHYQDDDFETSGVLPSAGHTQAAVMAPKVPAHAEDAVKEPEEDEYADDFNITQAINTSSATMTAGAAAAVASAVGGGYDEEDEELLMMLTSAPTSQKVEQSAAAVKRTDVKDEEEEDLYGDEEFL